MPHGTKEKVFGACNSTVQSSTAKQCLVLDTSQSNTINFMKSTQQFTKKGASISIHLKQPQLQQM